MNQFVIYPVGRYHVSLVVLEDGQVNWRLEYDGQRVSGGTEQADTVVFKILRMWQAHAAGHLLPKAKAVQA